MSFKNFSVSHTPSDPAKSPDAGDAGDAGGGRGGVDGTDRRGCAASVGGDSQGQPGGIGRRPASRYGQRFDGERCTPRRSCVAADRHDSSGRMGPHRLAVRPPVFRRVRSHRALARGRVEWGHTERSSGRNACAHDERMSRYADRAKVWARCCTPGGSTCGGGCGLRHRFE